MKFAIDIKSLQSALASVGAPFGVLSGDSQTVAVTDYQEPFARHVTIQLDNFLSSFQIKASEVEHRGRPKNDFF